MRKRSPLPRAGSGGTRRQGRSVVRRGVRSAAALVLAVLLTALGTWPGTGPAGASRHRPVVAIPQQAGSRTLVMRPARVDAAAIEAWFRARGPGGYRATVPLAQLIGHFMDEGGAQGVAPDVAFVQSVLETGWFTFPAAGQVRPEDNNFSGLGAVDGGGGSQVAKFATAQLGVRAQVQHLWAYADPSATAATVARPPVVDPRFDLVQPKGRAPSWDQFGNGVWATDAAYASKILALYADLLDFHGVRLRRWVTDLFQDVTGRTPTSTEVSTWATRALTEGRPATAWALTNTFSATTKVVHGYYWQILGRSSDSSGRAHYAEAVRRGAGYPDVVVSLASSSEFVRTAGPTSADYVRALYPALFGRTADASGVRYWSSRLDAGTPRAAVARTLHGSLEARRRRVDQRYRVILGRPADAGGLAIYAPILTFVDERWLDADLGASTEHFDRAQA